MFDKALLALPGIRKAFLVAAVFAVLQGALLIVMALCLAGALYHLWCGAGLLDQVPLLAGFAAAFLLGPLARSAQDAWFEHFAARCAERLRAQALDAVFEDGAALIDALGSAAATTLLLEDVDAIETYLRAIVARMVNAVVIASLIIVALFALDWVSGLITLVMMPVIVGYMRLLGSMARKAATDQRGVYEQLSNSFADALQGLGTLARLGVSQAWEGRIGEASERFRASSMRVLSVAILSGAVLDLISTLSLAAVAIMLGFRLAEGSVGLFNALAVLVLVPECFKPIRAFAADFHSSLDGKNAFAALRRLEQQHKRIEAERQSGPVKQEGARVIASVEAVAGEGEALAPTHDSQEKAAPAPVAQPSPEIGLAQPSAQKLAVEGLSFSYGDQEVLHKISFTAQPFERVALIGTSGAGKSTLASLVAGLYAPTAGVMGFFDETGAPLARDAWRREVLYIPQTPYIFHGTLRDNIAFYAPEATDADVRAAVRAVGLEDLVATLPNGLGSLIGQGARQLSGGQAHRIALARAFLDPNRRVLVFDEPTAHLDIETEQELKEPMKRLMEGRLVLFATHRLHWLDSLDRVIVLDKGRVSFDGAPSEAFAASSAFQALAAAQTSGFEGCA